MNCDWESYYPPKSTLGALGVKCGNVKLYLVCVSRSLTEHKNLKVFPNSVQMQENTD